MPGCAFLNKPTTALCDAHHQTFLVTRNKRGLDLDGFVAEWTDRERRLRPHYDFSALAEPLRSELRFGIQERLDENRHTLEYSRINAAAAWVKEMCLSSLLSQPEDWWIAQHAERWGTGAGEREMSFIRYTRGRLEGLRDRAYGVDPFSKDVWIISELGVPELAYQHSRTISFAGIESEWFKAVVKRWARWRLRVGTMSPGTLAGITPVLNVFCDFLRDRGEPLASPDRLTRELLQDYRVYVNGRDYSSNYRRELLCRLRVLLDDVRANGWEPRLSGNATYYRGEMPRESASLPRFIDEHVMTQIERPENIARLTDLTIRTAVIILIKTGLRAVDLSRLRLNPIVRDAAGAPVLLYYNHKLKREAALPVDDVVLAAIRSQQTAVGERYPAGSPWLFPSSLVNPKGNATLSTTTLGKRIHEWRGSEGDRR